MDEYAVTLLNQSRVKTGDKKVSLLGDTIAGGKIAPEPNDEIVILDKGKAVRLTVVDIVGRDPDAALYVCHCRG